MSMSEPLQPNLNQTDRDRAMPDDDLSLDDELAADDELADDDLDTDGTPAGDTASDDDLADLMPEDPVFRTLTPGDRLRPEDLDD
jgi:hypothetical protein